MHNRRGCRHCIAGVIAFFLFAQCCLAAPRRFPAQGLVLAIDASAQTITISHKNIPGLMDAMAMPFHVQSPKLLEGLHAGDTVAFTLLVDKTTSWVDEIRVLPFDSAERDPVLAGRLTTMDAITGKHALPPLATGAKADFHLIDQNRRPTSLSEFAGKVVAVDFVYTRCPLPDYCFRLSSNFSALQKRFASADLILLTISFDTAHDSPDELSRYARIWNANSRKWHFLTGPPAEVQRVCALFGVGYWPDDGVFTHTLHTAILDREGKLIANLEGNRFTAAQLGDLVQTALGHGSR